MNILNVEKVSKTYGEKQLFDEVTLGVNKGDKIGVIGVNGTGKSTFLKIIAGLEEADAGQVVGQGCNGRLSGAEGAVSGKGYDSWLRPAWQTAQQ